MRDPKEHLFVALDMDDLESAGKLIEEIGAEVSGFKVGLQMITRVGPPAAVKFVLDRGGDVFLDGKFHDIPNTMAKAAAAAASLGVMMFNVHAAAGIDAMMAAVENKGNAKVLAVTVLTSFDEECGNLSLGGPTKVKVLQFARDAKLACCDGVVCSPQELALLGKRKELGPNFLKVTPGVRPPWASANDQKRIMTPGEAIMAGATDLVVGRPIYAPPAEISSPLEAVKRIKDEMAQAYAALEAKP